jgi:integrase
MAQIAHRLKRTKKAEDAERTNYRTLPFDQGPDFVGKLRKQPGVASLALEFSILTAARTTEIRGATWAEVDPKRKLWTVPKERMKARKVHVVRFPARMGEL